MPLKKRAGNKKGKQSNFAKLSIFSPNKYKFKKSCPLSVKGAPEVDYKNIRLLKKIKKASTCTLKLKALEKLLKN